MNTKYRVDVIESEAGWGRRLDFQKDFDTKKEADDFVTDFNKDNNEDRVPSWYMRATSPYLVDLDVVRAPKK